MRFSSSFLFLLLSFCPLSCSPDKIDYQPVDDPDAYALGKAIEEQSGDIDFSCAAKRVLDFDGGQYFKFSANMMKKNLNEFYNMLFSEMQVSGEMKFSGVYKYDGKKTLLFYGYTLYGLEVVELEVQKLKNGKGVSVCNGYMYTYGETTNNLFYDLNTVSRKYVEGRGDAARFMRAITEAQEMNDPVKVYNAMVKLPDDFTTVPGVVYTRLMTAKIISQEVYEKELVERIEEAEDPRTEHLLGLELALIQGRTNDFRFYLNNLQKIEGLGGYLHFNRGAGAFYEGDIEEAERQIKLSLKNKFDHVDAHLYLVDIHIIRGKYNEAVDKLEEVEALFADMKFDVAWAETYFREYPDFLNSQAYKDWAAS